jgi:pyruvate kinase
MRRTKIVATIGPASSSPECIRELVAAGMDVARLNFSHGSHGDHAAMVRRLREAAAGADRPLALLQDLAGPKIRVGSFAAGSVRLEAGAAFVLSARERIGDEEGVSLSYAGLPGDVEPGDRLLLADGDLELQVEGVRGEDIHCRVILGGELGSRKGINLPSRSIRAPILSEKDLADLAFGLKLGVDYIALSFVRSAADVAVARKALQAAGGQRPLIAKIEKHEALAELDAIIDAVDGLMVARGDLGVEIPLERVPRVQKTIIDKANRAGKPVITATQMLRSMVDAPRPTRAEAADVANAILDGTDAVMLSEETAAGKYPVEAVRTMDRIARSTEADFPHRDWLRRLYAPELVDSPPEAVARAACELATRIGAVAILTLTRGGGTTRLVSRFRPAQPLLALTPEEETRRRLALVWGCRPLRMDWAQDLEDGLRSALRVSREAGLLPATGAVVVTAGHPLGQCRETNLIRVLQLDGE